MTESRAQGEDSTRELTQAVRREVNKLSDKWSGLWDRTTHLVSQATIAHKVRPILLTRNLGLRSIRAYSIIDNYATRVLFKIIDAPI